MIKRIRLSLMAVMALAFALCVGVSPALADTTYTSVSGGTTTFENVLVVESDSTIPALDFTFNVTAGDAVAASSGQTEILAGIDPDRITITNEDFNGGETTTSGTPQNPSDATKKYAKVPATVNLNAVTFTAPGIYRYKIRENNASYAPGVTYDTRERYLDVYVVTNADNQLYIGGYVLTNTEGSEKSVQFVNSIQTYDFEFTKAVTGNQADKNKEFSFTLAIENANPGTYSVVIDGSGTTLEVGSDGKATQVFNLKHGSDVKILGLNSGAKCKLTENQLDYTASYSIGGVVTSSHETTTINLTNDTTVAFTNTREGTIPTGVIVTVAPFAIGILVFGALALFLVSRRKRNDLS